MPAGRRHGGWADWDPSTLHGLRNLVGGGINRRRRPSGPVAAEASVSAGGQVAHVLQRQAALGVQLVLKLLTTAATEG